MKKCLALTMTLFVLTGLLGCGGDGMEAPKLLEPVAVKMDVAKVQRGDLYKVATYNGEVVPYVEELHFSVDGYLEEISVMMGDTVEKGEVLATLSEEKIREQIETLNEEIEDLVKQGEYSDRLAAADIEIAKEELAILQEAEASEQECKVKELEVQKLELKLEQAKEMRSLELSEKQSSLETLQKKTENNEIIAPYSGTIVYISDVENADAIQAYEPVIYIADDTRLSLSSEYVSEADIAGADKIYAKIQEKEYEITYIPYEKSEYVTMLLSGLEVTSKFSIDAGAEALSGGEFAAVMVLSSYREDVLTIPANALYRDENGRYVYKQVDDARVRCDVTVGLVTDTKAEITEGLQEGDVVYVKE